MKEILCHGCMEPYEINPNQRIECPHCHIFQYCTNSCRINDWKDGGHSYHCSFIKQLKKSEADKEKTSLIQIACDEELFYEYEMDSDGTAKPTGKQLHCSIGDQGSIFLFPNEFDSAGSFLIHVNERIVLCDVYAMEYASPISKNNLSLRNQTKSNELWKKGLLLWNEKKDLRHAMILFEKSLDCFKWNTIIMEEDDVNTNDICIYEDKFSSENVSPYLLKAMSQPSTISQPLLRTCLAKRLFFLAMCLNDDHQSDKAIQYLIYCLQTKNKMDKMRHAFIELMLTYEEMNHMNNARAIVHWFIMHTHDYEGERTWMSVYQRPGYIYYNPSKPVYISKEYPKWCSILQNNYKIIQNEFLNLWHANNEYNNVPIHWPQVGERVQHDHRVVSKGDWREFVLFGPNATTANTIIAPKTKEWIQTYAPDVISLCNLGGGEVIFSILAPHTYIAPHCANSNIRLTAHLGLQIPNVKWDGDKPKCGIRIETQWHEWKEGQFLIFDDSYEHEVINDTDECRCVLLLRFWHPAIKSNHWNSVIQDIMDQKKMAEAIRFNPPL